MFSKKNIKAINYNDPICIIVPRILYRATWFVMHVIYILLFEVLVHIEAEKLLLTFSKFLSNQQN